jgi:hypothetical protein
MSTYLHGLKTRELIDSVYHELNIMSPSSYYYDSEWGVRVIGLALQRAFSVLNRHLRKEDTQHFQATTTVTVSSGTPCYVTLPTGFVALISAYCGTRLIEMHVTDIDTMYHTVNGANVRSDRILATRSNDVLYLHSTLVSAGDSVVLRYYREVPLFVWVGTCTYTLEDTNTNLKATPDSYSAGDLAYDTSEWVGGLLFSMDQSKQMAIVTSTTGYVKGVKPTGATANTVQSTVLINTPALRPEVIDAIISQACLIIKGEDLNGWSARVANIRAGHIRSTKVSLPRNYGPFHVR